MTHLSRKLDPIGRGHMQVQEGHLEFSFVEKGGSLRASCQCYGLHASGSQNLFNHLANRILIIHDQTLFLHDVPPMISSTSLVRCKKLRIVKTRSPRSLWPEAQHSRYVRPSLPLPWRVASNRRRYDYTGCLVAIKLHAHAELSPRGINWLDTYYVA